VDLKPPVLAALTTLVAGVAAAAPPQLLVVLEPTGKTRDGLPIRAAASIPAVFITRVWW